MCERWMPAGRLWPTTACRGTLTAVRPTKGAVAVTLEARSLDKPEETRMFGHGSLSVVNLPGATVGRAEFEPGWRWSNDVKPIAGTGSCQQAHTGFVLSGSLHVVMDDGAERDLVAGDAYVISPGHDAWVVGSQRFVTLDWSAAETYAK